MTATQTRIRRGTAAQIAAFTPASSEVVHDTTNNRLHVGNGSTAGGFLIPNGFDIQNGAVLYASAGGTANDLTATFTPAVTSYVAGQLFRIRATATNTGAATLNVQSLGTKNILKMQSGSLVSLVAGDIVNTGIYEVAYDGTQFQLLGNIQQSSQSAGLVLLQIANPSSQSSFDFTAISSAYEEYEISLALSHSASSSLFLRVSDGTFKTGASDYWHARTTDNYISGSSSLSAITDSSSIVISDNPETSNFYSFGSLKCSIRPVGTAAPRFQSDITVTGNSASRPQKRTLGNGVCVASLSPSVTGLRILTSTGTVTGVAYLYGKRTSL